MIEAVTGGDGDGERIHAIASADAAQERTGEPAVVGVQCELFKSPLPREQPLLRDRTSFAVELRYGMGGHEEEAVPRGDFEERGDTTVVARRGNEDARVKQRAWESWSRRGYGATLTRAAASRSLAQASSAAVKGPCLFSKAANQTPTP